MCQRTLSCLRTAPLFVAASVCLQACSSGSGGSDVGDAATIAPTARAQILNGAGIFPRLS